MTTERRQITLENLYLTLRPLRERARLQSPGEYFSLSKDIESLISAVGSECVGDSKAMSALGVAKLLLSLGHAEAALEGVRAILINAGAQSGA